MGSSARGVEVSRAVAAVPRRETLLLLILFWTLALAISLVRYGMQGRVGLGVMAPHIAAVSGFGALLCWCMAQLLEGVRTHGFIERALWGISGAAAMSVLQSIFHMATCRISPIEGLAPMSVAEAMLAAMISFTYFAGWTGMHLALLYHHQARIERSPASPTVGEGQGGPPADASETIFWASRGRQVVRVRVAEILWVEAQKDYVQLHASGGGGMLRETLQSVQAKLDPGSFVRVHRSAIVRRSEVAAIRRKPSGALALGLASGVEVPVGRSYAKGLRDLMGRVQDPA